MKGLSPQQLVEITEFAQRHHKFGYVRPEDQLNGQEGYCIKYIDACYDSRQGDYWAISFRGFGKTSFTTNAFTFDDNSNFPYSTLFDWIMAFLKYEWEPAENFKFMHGEKEGPLHNSFPKGEIEREWSDIDMMNAYCADLEDGATTEDMADACKWIIDYRNKQNKKS